MNSDSDVGQVMTLEDRLKVIACQFIGLYERWSEDHQVITKQCFELTELIQRFEQQVDSVEKLEPKVCHHLTETIDHVTTLAAGKIGTEMGQRAIETTVELTRKLATMTEKTEQTLLRYQRDMKMNQWKIIGVSAFTTIATCFLAMWLLIPKLTLPLSHLDMDYLRAGKVTISMWSKLSKSEKDRWMSISLKVPHFNSMGIPADANH